MEVEVKEEVEAEAEVEEVETDLQHLALPATKLSFQLPLLPQKVYIYIFFFPKYENSFFLGR